MEHHLIINGGFSGKKTSRIMEPLVDVSIQIEVLISRIMDLNDCHVTRGRIKLLPSSSWVPRWCWRVCCPRSGFGSWRPKRRRCPEIPGKWRFEWEKLVENHGTSPRKLERKKTHLKFGIFGYHHFLHENTRVMEDFPAN